MPEEDAFMGKSKVQKSYREINERIRRGKAVVVTAEEMIDIVRDRGDVEAARYVDVVTTGTFSPDCVPRGPFSISAIRLPKSRP